MLQLQGKKIIIAIHESLGRDDNRKINIAKYSRGMAEIYAILALLPAITMGVVQEPPSYRPSVKPHLKYFYSGYGESEEIIRASRRASTIICSISLVVDPRGQGESHLQLKIQFRAKRELIATIPFIFRQDGIGGAVSASFQAKA